MNNYYHKYIKYKTKYFDIKYGGKKPKKPKIINATPQAETQSAIQAETQAEIQSVIQSTTKSATPPSTPQQNLSSILTPSPISSISSTAVASIPSTPKLEIDKLSLERLIKNKDELVCLLSSYPDLSDYDITSRPTVKMHLYINFKKKGEVSDFAHFSFHNPEENSLRLGDMFEANTFHLKLDNYDGIVFNLVLDEEQLKLKSKLNTKSIKKIIKGDFSELKKIITYLEKILNLDEYKVIITDPIVKKILF